MCSLQVCSRDGNLLRVWDFFGPHPIILFILIDGETGTNSSKGRVAIISVCMRDSSRYINDLFLISAAELLSLLLLPVEVVAAGAGAAAAGATTTEATLFFNDSMDTPLNISNFFPKPLNICFAAAAVAFRFKFCVKAVDGAGAEVDAAVEDDDGCMGEGGLLLLLLLLLSVDLCFSMLSVAAASAVSVSREGEDGGVGRVCSGVGSAWDPPLLLLESWKLPMKELTVVAMPAGFIAPILTKDPGALFHSTIT